MRVTYGPSKISCAIHKAAAMQRFQSALAYFDTVVSYAHKMFIKPTPGPNVIKLFCP
jgi:hypothetical protein